MGAFLNAHIKMKAAFIPIAYLVSLLFITAGLPACTSKDPQTPSPTAGPALVPTLTVPPTSGPPSPASPGQAVSYGSLQVMMGRFEFTDNYQTQYNTFGVPSPGQKFLWVQVLLEETGKDPQALPGYEYFSALLDQAEFKPSYAHRKDYPDYTDLNGPIFPGQKVEGWLRFSVPKETQFSGLIFAFSPESTQVALYTPSTLEPWAEHPLYLWSLTP